MIEKLKLKLPRKRQVKTTNRCISTVMYFEDRPLTSRPHLRKVSSAKSDTFYGDFMVKLAWRLSGVLWRKHDKSNYQTISILTLL